MKVKRILVSVLIAVAALLGALNTGGISAKAESNNNLKIWAWGPYAEAAHEAANIYSAINPSAPQINIRDNFDSPADMMIAFDAASASGIGVPDIMIMKDSYLWSYNDRGDILPCGVHYSSEPAALYYNNSIMEAPDITIGSNLTWDQFRDIGYALKDNNPNMYLFKYDITVLQTLLFSGDITDLYSTVSQTAGLLEQLHDEGLMYHGTQNAIDMLRNGQLASVIGGPWLVPTIAALANEEEQEWRVTKIPKSDTFSREVYLGGYSWVISNYSTKITEAVEFLRDMFQVNAQFTTTMAEETLIVPVHDLTPTPLNNVLPVSTNFRGQNNQHPIEFLFDIFGYRNAAFCLLGGDPTNIGFAYEAPGGFEVAYIDLPAEMLELLNEWMEDFLDGEITREALLELLEEWLDDNEFYDFLW